MKAVLSEYYVPTEEEFKTLWNDAYFIFDANVLLNLYRYSQETSKSLLEILSNEKIQDRAWMPYQFALEYQRNRPEVIDDQKKLYKNIVSSIEGMSATYPRHPFLDVSKLTASALEDVRKKEADHPDWNKNDPIREQLTEIFSDKIGEPYSKEKLADIFKEGAERYARKIPPGFEDSKKPEEQRFGDLVGWRQIIEFIKEKKKPFILISDDASEDWCCSW